MKTNEQENTPTKSASSEKREEIRGLLTYCLPSGITEAEWEIIINNVEAQIQSEVEKAVKERDELFVEMKEYIERVEEQIDGEWGSCRDYEKLIEDNEMPELYNKIINLITSPTRATMGEE